MQANKGSIEPKLDSREAKTAFPSLLKYLIFSPVFTFGCPFLFYFVKFSFVPFKTRLS